MTEVLVSAVNVADTSDTATAVERAVAMTKSFAEGLVTQAASGQKIMTPILRLMGRLLLV